MKRIRQTQAGMSLLEVMFAAGIMATALSLLFGSLISISLVGAINEDRAIANTTVASLLEEIRSLDHGALLAYVPETPAHPGAKRVVTLECFGADGTAIALPLATDDQGNVVNAPSLPNPLEVRVTLLWQNDRGHVFQSYATTSMGR